MSNHFTGLSLGAPVGDPRLDLYAFQSPADENSRHWLTLARLLHPLGDLGKHKLSRSRAASKEWDAHDDVGALVIRS